MRTPTILLGAMLLCAASSSLAQLAEGDQQWAVRAEGHQGGHAKGARVDAAIGAYQKAVSASPNDLEARYKLLRALRFKAAYATSSQDDKKKLYTQAKKAGEDALTVVDRALAAKKISSVSKATEKQIADAAKTIPHAGEVFLWDAVNWGEWALAYGKMAAVREGAADKIKREATIAMMVDPTLEGGAPSRVLGRLHDQTPHVPFITGWASSKEAVRLLNESLKIDPSNKITRTFLAEALVSNSSDAKPQAVVMLKDVVSSPNNETYAVEEAAAQDDARALLKEWGR